MIFYGLLKYFIGGSNSKEDNIDEWLIKKPIPKLSDMQAFFTLIKGFVGTGWFFLPNGFYNGGWGFSICCILWSMILTLTSMLLLVEASSKVKGDYSELGFKSLGKVGKYIWDLTLSLSQIGFLTVHSPLISQNINQILMFHFGIEINIWFIGVFIFFILTPLWWVRKIEYFAQFHIFADFIMITVLLTILSYGFNFAAEEGSFSQEITVFNQDKFLVFFGTSIFLFEGVGVILPIRESWQKPQNFPKILTLMIIFLTMVLIIFGLINYLIYGDLLSNAPSITKLMPVGSLPYEIVILLFIINLVITFPLILYPSTSVVESYLFRNMTSPHKKWLENSARTWLVMVPLLIGITFEDTLDRLLSIVGSLTW